MNSFNYGTFNSSNTDIAFSATNEYTNPTSELLRRKQLSFPLKELKDFINGNIIPNLSETSESDSADFTGSNFEIWNDHKVNSVKTGKVINVTGVVRPKVLISASTDPIFICKLPSGYEPKYDQRAVMQSGEGEWWGCLIETNGNVSVVRFTKGDATVDIPANHWMMFSMTYIGD